MPESFQEKPLHELLSRSMVDIYVGPENTHWVLHEKLLCYHSPHFRKIFYSKSNTSKTYGLPDEEDATFKTFVGWLYSSTLPQPREESDLGILFDLYLLAEKFQIPRLEQDILQVVREWYKYSDTYPGLRRVQYVYANTVDGSPMRHMLVHSVARMLVLSKEGMPRHWEKALKKNGQLAVDIIRGIQQWGLEDEQVPDAREEPSEAEELVGEEEVAEAVNREVGDEEEGEGEQVEEGEEESEEQEGEEQEGDAQSEGLDSNEETIVDAPDAPAEQQQQKEKPWKEVRNKSAEKKEKRSDSAIEGIANLDIGEVVNEVA